MREHYLQRLAATLGVHLLRRILRRFLRRRSARSVAKVLLKVFSAWPIELAFSDIAPALPLEHGDERAGIASISPPPNP